MGRRKKEFVKQKAHIDKIDALNKYVRYNILKLTSSSASKELEKSLRIKFFQENALPSNSRFTAKEVAVEIVRYILRSRSFGLEEFVVEVMKIPFITEELTNDKINILYNESSKDSSLFFNPSDLSKLSQEDYLRHIEEEFKNKAKERAEEEISVEKEEVEKLREELAREKEELKRYETELNKLPKDLNIEQISQKVEREVSDLGLDIGSNWWKKLGMPSNPLETYDGLYGIAQDKYDKVVVRTSLLNQYLSEFRDNPESFSGKTMIIVGDYGSGKTTLFDYLTAQAVSLGVVPITVVLNPGPSVASLTNIFLQELRDQLIDTSKSIQKTDFNSGEFTTNLYRDCLEIFRKLSVNVSNGFLIFIDGLHKTNAYRTQVFEFLQQAQNTLTYFTRNKIKLGFIIAGSQTWKFELENNPSMSGSFYRIDEIPILTEEDAVEAIKRRINLYQAEVKQTMSIDENSLRKSFQVLSGRLPNPVNFRDFISHVRRRLDLNRFEEVGLSVKIHIETVDAVEASLRRSYVYSRYRSLLLDISDSISVRKALQRVIANMIRFKGISESNPIFEKNKGAFYLLKKHEFIVQHKTGDLDQFKWHLSDDMITAILEIGQHLKLEPSKIVQAMFEEETIAKEEEANSIYSASVNTIRTLISSWKESIPEVTELLSNSKKGIDRISSSVVENKFVRSSDLSYPIMQIIQAINVIMGPNTMMSPDGFNDFIQSWAAPDNIDEIVEYCQEKVERRNETAKLYGLLHNHNRIISQLLDILSEQVKGEALSRLNGRKLTLAQFSSIHQLRMKFQLQAYEDVIDGACNLIEKSIRGNVYPSMRAIWGNDALYKIPLDLQQKIKAVSGRGHPRTKRTTDPNFFYDISRSEYTKIMFKRDIYDVIFGKRLSEMDQTKLKDALELAFSLDDRHAHRDRKSYFRIHATEIADVLKNLPWVLEELGKFSVFLLTTCKVNFKKTSATEFSGSFTLDQLNSKEIAIEKRNIDIFSRAFLETLSFKELTLDIPEKLFPNLNMEPENCFILFRLLLVNKYIECKEALILPGLVTITQEGRELLEKYQSNSVEINQS